ncbi:MAG: ATP-binding protein, partial [Thermodesulfovibrionaceae bacterium]
KKYFLTIFLTFLLFTVLGFQIYLLRVPPEQIPTRFIVVFLFIVNIIALITLGFFVFRSIFRLYLERQREVPGHRFKIKLVSIFGGLILIPSVLLFFAFSGVLESSIEKLFSKSNRKVISEAVDVVKAFYEFEKDELLRLIEDYAQGKIKNPVGVSIAEIKSYSEEMPESVKEAFQGKKSSQIISSEKADLILAAIPYKGGVLLAKKEIPYQITKKVNSLRSYYEEYLQVGSLRKPIKSNYLMFLSFLSLIIIFLAIWISMKISQQITNPIQQLVQATEIVSAGNLKVRISAKSSDEIGILVKSFNGMIEKLDKAYGELSQRNILLERILSNITSGIMFLGVDGKILKINKAGEDILEVENIMIENKHYSEILKLIESEEIKEFINKISQERITEITKDFTLNVKGQTKIIKARIISLRETQSGKSEGILVVFDDLTEVLKAQQAIAWQEVAKRLAHEIKNPLTPIKLATERMIKKWKSKDSDFEDIFEKSTKTIIREVESLKNLIDAFQRFGKLPEIKKQPTNLYKFFENIIELYRGYKNIKINFVANEPLKDVLIDPEEFKRVIINIIDNAIRAMNAQGEITISVKLNNSLVVEIADEGPGIDEEIKDKLFLPYFSKTKEGTGLGLAIARKIITEHGGTISLIDNKPKGTIFRIEVPA